jgi:F0F1-type ATP synthase assembly protein I
MKTTAAQSTPPSVRSEQSAKGRSTFVSLAVDMTWKLAIAVMVPIIGGVYIDKAANTDHVFTFIGLALAALGSIGVMWQTVQTANSLPVPKLSAAEKRQIQKEYEEDDADA